MATPQNVSGDMLRALEIGTEDFRAMAKDSKPEANIVIMGRAGSGKSSLVNGLCGAVTMDSLGEPRLPATEGHKLKHETSITSRYAARETTIPAEVLGGAQPRKFSIFVWDSPGLFDGEENERAYVLQVKHQCEEPDLLLYCIDMSGTRCIVDEMAGGMMVITENLGRDVWKHAIIVFTFANNVRPPRSSATEEETSEYFRRRVDHWQKKAHKALVKSGVDEIAAERVVIEVAGNYITPNLPTRQQWLGTLWLQVINCAHHRARFPIVVNTHDRVNNSEFLAVTFTNDIHAGLIDRLFGPLKRWIQSLARRKQRS